MRRLIQRVPLHRRIVIGIGLFYYLSSIIILRDVLFAIPSVLNGTKVINGDELVPYFNPQSQLLEQAAGEFNQLTHGYEFRVRYSFLTTWVRYYKVLPFALVFGLPSIVFAAYLTVSWFIRRTFTDLSPTTVALACGFPTAFIYGIMIYAKVTHFYTLVAGLCLMTISSLTMMYALIFKREKWIRWVVLSCFVALLNPAVHYLVLFGIFFSLAVVTLVLGELSKWIRDGGPAQLFRYRPRHLVAVVREPRRIRRIRAWVKWFINTTIGRCGVAGFLLLIVTLIPYALFVKFIALRGVGDLSQTVPGGYYFIRDASVSLVHILSWDLAGIMDKILFGDYLAKVPRVMNMVYMVGAFVPLLVPGIRGSIFRHRPHRQLLGVIYTNVCFAIWATVGYGDPTWFPTFHRSMAAITRALYATDTPIGELALGVSSTVVQVLRFPHRFQLILFMIGPVIMSLLLAWIIERLNVAYGQTSVDADGRDSSASVATRVAITIAIGTVFFLPFFANTPYREVFGSGNLSHFVTAYPVEDLAEVKQELLELPEGKTAVFPPTETSKLVVDPNGAPHKFIDKFYIYYLDRPSYYYGLTGDAENKFEFFLIMRGLYYQQDWWINIARDIDLEYIILNKQIENNRGVGAEYLPDLELYLRTQLEAQPDHVEQLFENDSFILYRLDVERVPEAERDVLLFNSSWNGFLQAVFTRLELSRCYDLQYITNFKGVPTDGRQVHLLATDVTGAQYDLWAKEHPESFFIPSGKIYAFEPNIVSSNYYLSPMFRLFLFFSDTKWNRTEMITPGLFGTLNNQFVATPRTTSLTVPVTIPEDGRYRVLMRGAATANQLALESPSLGYDLETELRSPDDALQLFNTEEVYDPQRTPLDVSARSVSDLEDHISTDMVPVNLRYVYFDLGTVEATAGAHVVDIDKLDENPMLFEGLLFVPEDEDVAGAAERVNIVDSVSQLDCSEESDVRYGPRDPYVALPAAKNAEHLDLTEEQMWELIGIDDLVSADDDGLGSRWFHLGLTLVIITGCVGVVRRRSQAEVDEALDVHPEVGVTRARVPASVGADLTRAGAPSAGASSTPHPGAGGIRAEGPHGASPEEAEPTVVVVERGRVTPVRWVEPPPPGADAIRVSPPEGFEPPPPAVGATPVPLPAPVGLRRSIADLRRDLDRHERRIGEWRAHLEDVDASLRLTRGQLDDLDPHRDG